MSKLHTSAQSDGAAGPLLEDDDPFAGFVNYYTGERPEWYDFAACAETDPEMFFPEKGGSTRPAKRVCGGCFVRAQCLIYALGNREAFGIWGGLSERERNRRAA